MFSFCMFLQYICTGKYTTACDMWSVGCVIMEMATGDPPWPQWASYEFGRLIYQVYYLYKHLLTSKVTSYLSAKELMRLPCFVC